LLDQVKVLNVSCKDEKELSLTILLKEVLVMGAVKNITAVIDNKMDKIPGY